jgi:S-adenosylmethionine-diacylglycerol 3-amino-3-carboxypropyl transferase
MSPSTWVDRLDQRLFNMVTSRSLVYNACWEDPAVDREILELDATDDVLVITSAGCNALDYALKGPRSVHAVDANPRQSALLELKMAALRTLEHGDFFALFGHGHHPQARELYRDVLRAELQPFARQFWDQRIGWFRSSRGSFYFHGLSGLAAYGFRRFLQLQPKLRARVEAMFAAGDLETQRHIYQTEVGPRLWTRPVNWILSSQMAMNLLGVPHPQRKLVEAQHGGQVAGFIREAIEYVVCRLPLRDNYFWRVYFTGRYEPDCCPEYLKPGNHALLRAGLVDRVHLHSDTVTGFLLGHTGTISRFVLLDHMDWMSNYYPRALQEEWEAILQRAAPGARILLRSAQSRPAYLESVALGPRQQRLRELLNFREEGIEAWQAADRVHTYAGLVIADAPA